MSAIVAPAPAPVSMWVITQNPSDHPGKFVARRHEIGVGRNAGRQLATGDHTVGDSLDEARAALPPGLVMFGRDANDDPVIVEVWL